MTSLRFIGDLPLWAGVLIALAVGLAAWRYYRRESHDLPGRLRWWLPLLRAAAFFLAVMTLTGPMLHHRQVIGELGRVLVFLDTSQSLSVTDNHMPVTRKLLVARQQGWIPEAQVDTSLWETADLLAEARRQVIAQIDGQTVDGPALDQCRQSFSHNVSEIADRIQRCDWSALSADGDDSAAKWLDIPERFRREVAEPAQTLLASPVDDDASRADVAGRLVGLSELAAMFERTLGDAFEAYGTRLAASGNPAIASALGLFDQASRWRRAENALLDSPGLLAKLTSAHDVELIGLLGSEAEGLWDPQASRDLPAALDVKPEGRMTDLASGIAGEMSRRLGRSHAASPRADSEQRTAVVLITDGRHNSGSSPIQAARLLGGQQIPVYAVGFGCRREPSDLAVVEVEHPDMVFQKNRIRGTVVVKDQMPPGQSFVVQIAHGDEVLWQQRLRTQDVPLRRIDSEFSIDELVERLRTRFDAEVRHHALPLSLEASIAPLEGETETSNNALAMRFAAITQGHKLLLIDGRSRWEIRYLRNLFQRDDQWEVNTILAGPATDQAALPRGDGPNVFPTDRAALFDYDLIVLGEVPPGVLADYEQAWIRSFVEDRGGGIVFLDGPRGHLRQLDEDTLQPLLPVTWDAAGVDSLPTRLQLTGAGASQSPLVLESAAAANERLWQQLPPPHRIVPVEAVPGTEVFVEAIVDGKPLPAIVTRSFGAGRVLYFAFDETWRWRYKVADAYHQRFWNQVAKWIIQRPFAVSDRFVSIDSGPPSYASGEAADVRVRLQGVDGRPVTGATVDALLWKDGRIVSTVSLAGDDTGRGIYRGRTGPLSEGQYEVSVRASGFSDGAMKARTRFVVLEPASREMNETACNDDLLREMAAASGGRFLREEQIGELPGLLRPLSSGHVIESDTLLWQSYWWFAAIVGLLTVEWMLRKRAGLL
ncbi:MAG: hypothetical protein ACYTG0_03100 [Planctomycetota bacterium]